MAVRDCNEPIHDKGVEKILSEMAQGKTRQELALEMNYKNPVSMDNYMRRRNFSWDSSSASYIPAKEKYGSRKNDTVDYEKNTTAGSVVLAFSQRGSDAVQVAKAHGFESRQQLGSFMLSKGYKWDATISNYRKSEQAVLDWKDFAPTPPVTHYAPLPVEAPPPVFTAPDDSVKYVASGSAAPEVTKFIPLLEKLYSNMAKVDSLLETSTGETQLPRFRIAGGVRPKTIQMHVKLTNAMEEFAKTLNLSQKDLFEIAMVDFLKKYGKPSDYGHLLQD